MVWFYNFSFYTIYVYVCVYMIHKSGTKDFIDTYLQLLI